MKTAIITDQHFGMRKGNRIFHDYFQKFYDDVFFPVLEKEKLLQYLTLGTPLIIESLWIIILLTELKLIISRN